MNYATIKNCDIANGPGVRVSLFVSGCTHKCPGCFNEVAWDFQYGEPFTKDVEDRIIEMLRPDYVQGLTLLGGEPLEHSNQKGLLPFLRRVREELPKKDIWCFTGYVLEPDILGKMIPQWEETKELLSYVDVLVDGPFVEEKKSLMLRFRGSANQRIMLVKESLAAGTAVLWNPTDEIL